jgi:hypothetical protein
MNIEHKGDIAIMKKYYIGIVIICLLTLGFAGYVAYVGLSSKQDVATLKKAREIEPKLNDYVQQNQKIPASLDEVGVSDVPTTIKFTKTSEKEYTFCVTYKAESGYNDYGLGQSLIGPALSGGATVYDDPNYYNSESIYVPESLYVSESHKKGENCQNIKPYFRNSYQPPSYNVLPNEGEKPSSTSKTQSIPDSTRETDINTLQTQLEYYYGLNGFYPTLKNLNDKAWRKNNMYLAQDYFLSDPDSTSTVLVAKPQKKAYSYEVKPAGCDNDSKKCTDYTLTATKSDGTTFVKKSLNVVTD